MFKVSGYLNTNDCNVGGATTKSDCYFIDPSPPTDRSGKSFQEIPAGKSMTECFPSVPGRIGQYGDVIMIRDLVFSI